MVLRVDREKGYIDLSKRRVDPDSIAKCEDRYNKAKAVHRVLRQVSGIGIWGSEIVSTSLPSKPPQ